MNATSTASRTTTTSLLTGGVAAAMIAASAIGSAPTAGATCFSAFGLGSGGACTSSLTSIAIAIGDAAEAHADGFLSAAVTLGTNSVTRVLSNTTLGAALAVGSDADVTAGYVIAIGIPFVGNLAVSLGNTAPVNVLAAGVGAVAVNLFGGSNTVTAQGPLAISGSIAQTGATVSMNGPGININGLAIPPAASRQNLKRANAVAKAAAAATSNVKAAGASTRRPASTARAAAAN